MAQHHYEPIRTTLGDLIAACYEAALAEVGDEDIARRLAALAVTDVLSKSGSIQ
jgi:hypothetical protein